jgi:MYXO-CTERM domain-containing protein
VGLDPSVAGVSPFTTDCSIIENSVVFTFTNAFAFTAREACEIMAQEVAHSYGLDHELLAADPMTYLPYTGNRSFQDVAAQCGESMSAPRQCGIAGNVCRATQNSVQLLRDRLGIADSIMPTIPAMSPVDNATVPPGFQVKLTAADNNSVIGATLKIDGTNPLTIDGAGPFVFQTPAGLSEGSHVISVDVSDGKNIRTETRTVVVMIGAPPPEGSTPGTDELDRFGEVSGGCSSGRTSGPGALFAFGILLAFAIRRRA